MSQHITVVDYNPLWPKKYEEEALLIKDILADNCVAIYHIGSTSVEGLAAKPIIDIMAAVQNLEKVDDTACSLGMCAERNAIANMITNGENGICRLIAVDRNGKAIPPCGACREFMVQLMPDHYHSIQIMMDYENKKMVTLGDITPNWWI